MSNGNSRLDAVIIGGDIPTEFLGKDVRERMRLSVDGYPASLPFLDAYFAADRNANAAAARLAEAPPPFISLNGPYLRQFLSSQGMDVQLVPLLSRGKDAMKKALDRCPRAVVISTTFLPFAEHIDGLAANIKRLTPEVTVIAGGIQVWKSFLHQQLLHQGLLAHDILDAVAQHSYLVDPCRPSPVDHLVVQPHGEETLLAVLRALRTGHDVSRIPNTATQINGRWELSPQMRDPAHEISIDWRQATPTPADAYLPLQAGEGCGFGCRFCDFCGLRGISTRETDSLIAEISTMPEDHEGRRRVYFTDDNLFASSAQARKILTALKHAPFRLRWRGMARIQAITPDVASLMADTGCTEVLLGIESGDPELLQQMGKRTTPEQILAGMHALSAAGVCTKSTFIVGYPGETERTLANTVAMLNAFPTQGDAIHRYLFFRFGVLPLSEVASPASRERYNLQGYGFDWEHSTMNSKEAVGWLEWVHGQIREELNPSYVQELPEHPRLSRQDLKRVVVLRNRLAAASRQGKSVRDTATHWDELAKLFAAPTRMRTT